MIVDNNRIRVLCYGDSNTWARHPVLLDRHRIDARWPGTLQRLLGDKYDVIEEGLGGRTVNQDDRTSVGKNGKSYLTPCIESHVPINILIVMLGTNDLKSQFESTPETISAGLAELIDDAFAVFDKVKQARPRVIILSPVHLLSGKPEFEKLYGHAYELSAGERSKLLSDQILSMCIEKGLEFMDAQDYAHAGEDGIHLSADSHKTLAQAIADKISS